MTEDQKTNAVAALEERADIAERRGLKSTASTWRRYAETVRGRPAAEIVLSERSPFFTGVPELRG